MQHLAWLYVMMPISVFFFFFFNDTATTEIYTLSLHDALPIYPLWKAGLFHQPDHLDRTEGSIARRLRHNSIPGDQRRSELPSDRCRWKVPRSNRGDHTDRESENHDSLAGVVAGQNINLNPTSKLSIVLGIRRSTVNLAASLEQRLSLLRSKESG